MGNFSVRDALRQRILPAVTFEKEVHVLPVADALMNAGLPVMEIPFRTTIAEKAVEAVRKLFPAMSIGAGTILSIEQLKRAMDAGAQFGLSPGFNRNVCMAAKENNFPFIPGVMTPSEIEGAVEMGFNVVKLFPAEQIGGVSFLKAMQGPYAQLELQFIPMGGVKLSNMHSYLQQKNVVAVGGSWLAPVELMEQKNYDAIRQNVMDALKQTD